MQVQYYICHILFLVLENQIEPNRIQEESWKQFWMSNSKEGGMEVSLKLHLPKKRLYVYEGM